MRKSIKRRCFFTVLIIVAIHWIVELYILQYSTIPWVEKLSPGLSSFGALKYFAHGLFILSLIIYYLSIGDDEKQ